jgi:hypothetical protein
MTKEIKAAQATALAALDALRDLMQDRFDGKSERWEESEAGMNLEAQIETVEDARDMVDVLK